MLQESYIIGKKKVKRTITTKNIENDRPRNNNTLPTVVSTISDQTTLIPLPSVSPKQVENKNLTTFSTYSDEDENIDVSSLSKRKKTSPATAPGVGDGAQALSFPISQAQMVESSVFSFMVTHITKPYVSLSAVKPPKIQKTP